MGLLDDAIREHLELKRRHGATEQELRRQEEEALGPARREVGAAAEEPEIEAVEDEDEDAARPVVGAEDGAPGGAEVDDELGAHPDEVEWEEPGPAAEEDGPDPERGRDEPLEREPLAHGPDDAEQEPVVETHDSYEPEGGAHDEEPLEGVRPGHEDPAWQPEPEDPDAELLAPDEVPSAESLDAPTGDTPAAGFEGVAEEGPSSRQDAVVRPAGPAGERHPDEVHEDDVLEDTPDFLQETPEHDRLWFEQKPPRDFDFD